MKAPSSHHSHHPVRLLSLFFSDSHSSPRPHPTLNTNKRASVCVCVFAWGEGYSIIQTRHTSFSWDCHLAAGLDVGLNALAPFRFFSRLHLEAAARHIRSSDVL